MNRGGKGNDRHRFVNGVGARLGRLPGAYVPGRAGVAWVEGRELPLRMGVSVAVAGRLLGRDLRVIPENHPARAGCE